MIIKTPMRLIINLTITTDVYIITGATVFRYARVNTDVKFSATFWTYIYIFTKRMLIPISTGITNDRMVRCTASF